jgi:hypothetical protein
MPSFDVDFEVFCECGYGLCKDSTTEKDRHGNLMVTVTPCPRCLQKARDAGYDDGYQEGSKEE